jgi:hypothetical protein
MRIELLGSFILLDSSYCRLLKVELLVHRYCTVFYVNVCLMLMLLLLLVRYWRMWIDFSSFKSSSPLLCWNGIRSSLNETYYVMSSLS